MYMLNSMKEEVLPQLTEPKQTPYPVIPDMVIEEQSSETTSTYVDPEDINELRKRRKRNIER